MYVILFAKYPVDAAFDAYADIVRYPKPSIQIVGQYVSIVDARNGLRDIAIAHVRDECGKRCSETAFVDAIDAEKLQDGLNLYQHNTDHIELLEKKTTIESAYFGFSSTPRTIFRGTGHFEIQYVDRPAASRGAIKTSTSRSSGTAIVRRSAQDDVIRAFKEMLAKSDGKPQTLLRPLV